MTTHNLPQKSHNRIVKFLLIGLVMAVTLLAAGSMVLSFQALHDLALQHGQPAGLSWIWPLIIDLSLVAYTASILTFQLIGVRPLLPVVLTGLFGLVTIAGNLLHAPAGPVSWFVSILPPVSLLLTTELLRVLIKARLDRSATGVTQDKPVSQTKRQQPARPQPVVEPDKASRQQQVLTLLQTGQTQADIARQLDVSVRTVARDIKALNGQVTS